MKQWNPRHWTSSSRKLWSLRDKENEFSPTLIVVYCLKKISKRSSRWETHAESIVSPSWGNRDWSLEKPRRLEYTGKKSRKKRAAWRGNPSIYVALTVSWTYRVQWQLLMFFSIDSTTITTYRLVSIYLFIFLVSWVVFSWFFEFLILC